MQQYFVLSLPSLLRNRDRVTDPAPRQETSVRYGKRISIVVLAFALLVAALNVAARVLEGPHFLDDLKEPLQEVSDPQVAVLGASIAFHLYPGAMCLDGVSLASAGQDIFESEALLSHLADRGELPEVVILGRISGSYEMDNGLLSASRNHRRVATYRALHSLGDYRIIEDDWRSAIRSFLLPALGVREWTARIRMTRRRLARGVDREPDEALSTQVMSSTEQDERESRAFIATSRNELRNMQREDQTIPRRSLQAMLRMNALLEANGSRLVVVRPPLSPYMTQVAAFSQEETAARGRQIDDRLEAEGALLVNDDSGTAFSRDLTNFRDPTHLNLFSGTRYSRDLAQRLADAGIIPQPTCPLPQTEDGLKRLVS